MARGQSQAAGDQLKMTDAVAGQQQGDQKALESKLIPGYSSLMDTGYMNPGEEAAATTSEMGAATQPFQSMGFQASNRAAATRNPADLTAQQDQLALEEGQTAGQTAAGLQEQKIQNQEAGMYGLGQLKSQDQQEAASMYGLGPGTLNARAAGGSGDQSAIGYINALNPAKKG